jgi:hypothetical protein
LISHFPNDFQGLNNKRVPGNCFLLSSSFGLPSLARHCSCSAVSVVGLGCCSVAFYSALHSMFFDFLWSFSPFWLLWLFLMCFPSLAFAVSFSVPCTLSVFSDVASFWHIVRFLSGTLFASFLFSFLFAFVVVLVHLIPSLQSSSPRLFALSSKKIIFHCFALPGHCAIRMDRPHKIWN